MKIIEQTIDAESGFGYIEVLKAEYVGDFVLEVYFNDGMYKRIDFKSFIFNSFNPSINKYSDETLFKQYAIVDGNLNWNDYDMIFPLEDLHNGEIK